MKMILYAILLISIFLLIPNCSSDDIASDQKKISQIYNWLKSLQLENGILESSENSDYVSTYDNALAAIIFSIKNDFENAEKIFDFFNSRLASEMQSGSGGFFQFHYRNGEPRPGASRWLGDNAWLLIAINNYHSLSKNSNYNNMADAIENWIKSLQDFDGGLFGGYNENETLISNKITEGIIDAFNSVPGYTTFHSNILIYLSNYRWDNINKMFIAIPGDSKYKYALDNQSWGYSAFTNMPNQILTAASRYITTKTATINNKIVTGYCFDDDKDTIWLEGTGQMVVAFNTANMNDASTYYLNEIEKMFVKSKNNPELYGIPYTTNPGSHFMTDPLWTGAESNPCISSSAWYLLGKIGYDPMSLGKNKNIPENIKFWKN